MIENNKEDAASVASEFSTSVIHGDATIVPHSSYTTLSLKGTRRIQYDVYEWSMRDVPRRSLRCRALALCRMNRGAEYAAGQASVICRTGGVV